TGLSHHIAIESRQDIRSKSIAKKAVSTDAEIEHGPRRFITRGSEPARKEIRPAGVGVRFAPVAIRDRITQESDGSRRMGEHLDAVDKIPAREGGGIGQ